MVAFAPWRRDRIKYIPGAGLGSVVFTLQKVAKLNRAVYGWQDSILVGLNCVVSLCSFHSVNVRLSYVAFAGQITMDMY